jgi:TonB family protein
MNKLNAITKGLLATALVGTLVVPIAVGVLRGGSALAQDNAQSNTDVIPLVRIAPDYPTEAAQQGLEGHVVLEFTITAQGTTKDISVVESSAPIFEEPAITAVSRWRYAPRVVNGAGVEMPGIHTVIRFALDREAPRPGPNNPPQPGAPLIATPDDSEDD